MDAVVPRTRVNLHGDLHFEADLDAIKNENIDLKKAVNEQQEKSKRLLTKLNKLTEDLKKARSANASSSGGRVIVRPRRDVETEHLVDDLRSQIAEMSKSNSTLKSKLSYFKSLQEAQSRKRSPYDHVGPRIDGRTTRRLVPATSAAARSGGMVRPTSRPLPHPAPPPPDPEDITKLEDLINMLRSKLIDSEIEQEKMAEELRELREHAGGPPPPPRIEYVKSDFDPTPLQAELEEMSQRLKDVERRNRELESMNRVADGRDKELEEANRDLEGRNKEAEERIRELEARIRDVERKNRDLDNKRRDAEARVEDLEEIIQQMKANEEKKVQTIKDLREELKKERVNTVDLEEFRQECSMKTTRIRELEVIMSDLQEEKLLLETEQTRLLEAFKVAATPTTPVPSALPPNLATASSPPLKTVAPPSPPQPVHVLTSTANDEVVNALRMEVAAAREELERQRRESDTQANALQRELAVAKEELEGQRREGDAQRREAELHRKEADAQRGGAAALKKEVDELRNELKQKLKEQKSAFHTLETDGKESAEKLKDENTVLQAKYQLAIDELSAMRVILAVFIREDGTVDRHMIDESVTLLKLHREKKIGVDSLMRVEETHEDTKRLQQLRVEHAECVQELDKVTNMLSIQEKIAGDYKREIEGTKKRMAEQANEYEAQIESTSRLLDIRATRVAQLESQLKNIAYGTQKVVSNTSHDEDGNDEDAALAPGENLLYITFTEAVLSSEVTRPLGGPFTSASPYRETDETNLTTMLVFDFFDFETQCTSLGLGLRPRYSHRVRFRFHADDFFLHFCESRNLEVRLLRCWGLEWEAVGKCTISLRHVTSREFQGKASYVVNIVSETDQSTVLGTLDITIGTRLPMSQAVKAYHEREATLAAF